MIIDTCGRACPEPLVITRRAIAGAAPGSEFTVLNDNATSRDNLMSYLGSLGLAPSCEHSDGVYRISFAVGAAGVQAGTPAPQDFCAAPEPRTGGYAVALRSEVMGSGDDELGAMLMRMCINSLGELDRLPSVVALYNSGVKLCAEGTDTASSLAALAARGVRVVACGTCIDFFGLKGRTGAAETGNMLLINNLLAAASHIIYP